jgi:hypothetical protein
MVMQKDFKIFIIDHGVNVIVVEKEGLDKMGEAKQKRAINVPRASIHEYLSVKLGLGKKEIRDLMD